MSAYSIASRGLAGRRLPQGTLTPINALLFGSGEQGAWYDPSDMSTLFQDSAGTTPVTAVEQAVALMLDKSGRGNHAIQATSTKRPIYSRRVNLLQSFDGGVTPVDLTWGSAPASVRYVEAPDGSLTAVVPVTDAPTDRWQFPISANTFPNGTTLSYSYYKKYVAPTGVRGQFVGLTSLVGLGSGAYSETAAPNGFTRCTHLLTVTNTGAQQLVRLYIPGVVGADDLAVWGHDLRIAADAHLPYQRVNTATDYDADPAKFPAYLRFDGADDAMQTGNIDFTGTDKMTVWAGVTKLSDAVNALVYEFSPSESANFGTFSMWAPINVATSPLGVTARGLSRSVAATSTFSGVASGVVSQDVSLSAPSNALRLNGTTLSTVTTALGGSFGNHPLYIGARAGTTLYFNGRLYSLIVRGAQSSLSQIEAVENLIRKTMRLP